MANNPYILDFTAYYNSVPQSAYNSPPPCWSNVVNYTDGNQLFSGAMYGPANTGGPVFIWSSNSPVVKVEFFGTYGGGVYPVLRDVTNNNLARVCTTPPVIGGNVGYYVCFIDKDGTQGPPVSRQFKFLLEGISSSGMSIEKIQLTFS